jgi:hypothetical protein|eukprot:COSAG02_NODE_4551_length_5224_cov_16.677073_2_plen_74_part_00
MIVQRGRVDAVICTHARPNFMIMLQLTLISSILSSPPMTSRLAGTFVGSPAYIHVSNPAGPCNELRLLGRRTT